MNDLCWIKRIKEFRTGHQFPPASWFDNGNGIIIFMLKLIIRNKKLINNLFVSKILKDTQLSENVHSFCLF